MGIDDLKDVQEELIGVSNKWYNIGLQLHIQPGVLDSIMAHKDGHSCLCEMLKCWLKGVDPQPTWKMLVKALDSRSVSEADLAKQLKKIYCRKIAAGQLLLKGIVAASMPLAVPHCFICFMHEHLDSVASYMCKL